MSVQDVLDVGATDDVVSNSSSTCGDLQRMFDFTLLLSPSYLILCTSAVLPFIGRPSGFYEKSSVSAVLNVYFRVTEYSPNSINSTS